MATRGLRDSLRFLVKPESKDRISLKTVVVDVLLDACNVGVREILCLQDFPMQGIYDVTFSSAEVCWNAFERAKEKKENEVMKCLEVIPLFMQDEKMVIVHMYNPFADQAMVRAFLAEYCEVLKGGEKVLNRFKIWTGKFRFFARFKLDKTCIGGVRHPPSAFTIGGERGFLYYQGQPKYCRKCFSYGHVSAECEFMQKCRFCKQAGHKASDCGASRTCDICHKAGHFARQCSEYQKWKKTFAWAASGGKSREEEQRSTSGSGGKAGGTPKVWSLAGKLPYDRANDAVPNETAGSSGVVGATEALAVATTDAAGVTPADSVIDAVEGMKTGQIEYPDAVPGPSREEDEMETGVPDELCQGSSGEAEAFSREEELAVNLLANQDLPSPIGPFGDLSSSDDDSGMLEVEEGSEGSIECAQQEIFPVEIDVQPNVKRAREEGGVSGSDAETPPLAICFSGASGDEAASSPGPRRRQMRADDRADMEADC